MLKKVMRIGVYGVVIQHGTMLLVRQQKGPYAGKLDFPGGGIEFGESPEETLRREFLEEVAMEFDSMHLMTNLSVTLPFYQIESNTSYMFHQVGMVYRVEGCPLINKTQKGDLPSIWKNLENLSEEECSALLWKYRLATKNSE